MAFWIERESSERGERDAKTLLRRWGVVVFVVSLRGWGGAVMSKGTGPTVSASKILRISEIVQKF